MLTRVAAVVITRNEQRHIGDCLSALAWADELIVVDSFSSDATVARAEEAGAKVFQRPFLSFPRQRNTALALANAEWVLFVDADERVTRELSAEILDHVAESPGRPEIAGYWLPRCNVIWGKWIKGGGWFPDYQLRLLRRERAQYDEEREVHELVKLDGEADRLRNALVHYNYETLGQFFAKQRYYAALEGRSMFRSGIHPRPRNYVLQPLREAYRRYVQLGGFRDGSHGIVLASLMGYYTLVSYLELRRLRQAARG